MGLFKLIADSWNIFKDNFKTILILFILLSVIPSLILGYIGLPMLKLSSSEFYQTNQGVLYLTLSFLFMFLSMFLSSSILTIAFSSKKLLFKQALKEGSKYWISFIFLFAVLFVIFLLLSLPSLVLIYFSLVTAKIYLLIIGAILIILPLYFSVKFSLSIPILIGENKRAFSSIKRSWELSKGKFWKIFLFLMVFALLVVIFSQIFGGIGYLINAYTGNASLMTDSSTNMQYVQFTTAGFFIQQIFSLTASLFTFPISLIFLRKLYSEVKGK